MAAFLLHMLLLSVFAGVTARTDLLRPPAVTFAAAPPAEAGAPAPQPAPDAPPRKLDPASLGVQLTAPTAALVDTRSGEVLFSQGDDRVTPIASITKLMTALVLLDAGPDWDKPVTIEKGDNALEGIQYLKVGDTLPARDVFKVMLVGSANNCAMALSRSMGLTREEFVARMNSKARELGLTHTVFVDPTGYKPENRSAALEVARLAYAALARPEIRDALTTKALTVRTAAGAERQVPATDELLDSFLNQGDFQIVGGKTGFTDEAGYTLVLRAKKGDADVIAVVLGSKDSDARFQDAKSLLFWGFKTFEW
ncbi:MAG TPA: serine hydrolase [Candidatus Baltobacteraceae bacterium]|nr:serine hydrolase [Candidatus Baltobacteraceae bacterium]